MKSSQLATFMLALIVQNLHSQIGVDQTVELPDFSARSICYVNGSIYTIGERTSNSVLFRLNQSLQILDSLILPTGFDVVGNDISQMVFVYNYRKLAKLDESLSEIWSYELDQQEIISGFYLGRPFVADNGLCFVPKYHSRTANHGGCTVYYSDSCSLLSFLSSSDPSVVDLDLSYHNALEIRIQNLLSCSGQQATFAVNIAHFISCDQPVFSLEIGIFTFDLNNGNYIADYVASNMSLNSSAGLHDGSIILATHSYPQGGHYFTNFNYGEPPIVNQCSDYYISDISVSGDFIVALEYGILPGGGLFKIDEYGSSDIYITSYKPNSWLSCFVTTNDRVFYVNNFDQENMSELSKSLKDERIISFDQLDVFSTEPNHPISQNIIISNEGSRLLTIDSLSLNSSAFSYSMINAIIDVGCSITVDVTFQPVENGLYNDTLSIWANTDVSNSADPRLNFLPLIGEAGPIPAPVSDLTISILPDLSAQLSWSPVTQTIHGNPVTPDYYLIFYNEQDPADESDWYYLTPVVAPGYTHQLVARFRELMNYRVIAWKGIDPAMLGLTPGISFATFQQVSQDMRR